MKNTVKLKTGTAYDPMHQKHVQGHTQRGMVSETPSGLESWETASYAHCVVSCIKMPMTTFSLQVSHSRRVTKVTDNETAVTIYCDRTYIRVVSSKYLTVQFSSLISCENGGERCWQHNPA